MGPIACRQPKVIIRVRSLELKTETSKPKPMKENAQSQAAAVQDTNQALRQEIDRRTADLRSTVHALEIEVQERMVAEAALQKTNAKLKAFSKQALRALEADRRSVAKELHDRIGASLAVIKFDLEALSARQPRGEETIRSEELDKVIGFLAATIKESKKIATYLRPMMLDDFGLIATIGWFCRQFRRSYPAMDVQSRLRINEKKIGGLLKIVCFRIIQEAMNNAAKHSQADRIEIRLWRYKDHLRLKIQDNGRGFDPDKAFSGTDPLRGNGLTGMRERVEFSGGSFMLFSRPGDGTVIEAEFDLRQQP